jgi:tyrosyl-tRNA synthetase
MIKAESYKVRLESEEGLNFIEFNYMLLQAYDFLKLFESHLCKLQMGGSDQWGNIVAGVELVRRVHQQSVFGVTFPLITTSSGAKMGKTAEGAVWLDPGKTSPYEYYQFWINTDDRDVARFMALFTFLPLKEINKVEKLHSSELNAAKIILAFEATMIAHGESEAIKAYGAAADMFGHRSVSRRIVPSSRFHSLASDRLNAGRQETVPHSVMEKETFEEGVPAFKLYQMVGLSSSGSAARRLIEQGGAYVNGKRIDAFDYMLTDDDIVDMEIVLRAGKKRYHKIKIMENKP